MKILDSVKITLQDNLDDLRKQIKEAGICLNDHCVPTSITFGHSKTPTTAIVIYADDQHIVVSYICKKGHENIAPLLLRKSQHCNVLVNPSWSGQLEDAVVATAPYAWQGDYFDWSLTHRELLGAVA